MASTVPVTPGRTHKLELHRVRPGGKGWAGVAPLIDRCVLLYSFRVVIRLPSTLISHVAPILVCRVVEHKARAREREAGRAC